MLSQEIQPHKGEHRGTGVTSKQKAMSANDSKKQPSIHSLLQQKQREAVQM